MKEDNRVKFDSKIQKYGSSYYLRIPPEIAEHLDLDKDNPMKIQAEYTQKHGRYLSSWNPEQQQ